jgi:hypothetical protein
VDECRQAGGDVLGIKGANRAGADSLRDYTRDDACPGGRSRLGSVDSAEDPNGGVCCAIPPLLSFAACRAAGGEPVIDRGDGSSSREGCPAGRRLLGWLNPAPGEPVPTEGGICCSAVRR